MSGGEAVRNFRQQQNQPTCNVVLIVAKIVPNLPGISAGNGMERTIGACKHAL
jgi:hypothetical protein